MEKFEDGEEVFVKCNVYRKSQISENGYIVSISEPTHKLPSILLVSKNSLYRLKKPDDNLEQNLKARIERIENVLKSLSLDNEMLQKNIDYHQSETDRLLNLMSRE